MNQNVSFEEENIFKYGYKDFDILKDLKNTEYPESKYCNCTNNTNGTNNENNIKKPKIKKFYCFTCNHDFCGSCVKHYHIGHLTTQKKQIILEYSMEIENLFKNLDNVFYSEDIKDINNNNNHNNNNNYNNSISNPEEEKENIQKRVETRLIKKINIYYDEVIDLIEISRQQKINDIKLMFQNCNDIINGLKNQISETTEKIERFTLDNEEFFADSMDKTPFLQLFNIYNKALCKKQNILQLATKFKIDKNSFEFDFEEKIHQIKEDIQLLLQSKLVDNNQSSNVIKNLLKKVDKEQDLFQDFDDNIMLDDGFIEMFKYEMAKLINLHKDKEIEKLNKLKHAKKLYEKSYDNNEISNSKVSSNNKRNNVNKGNFNNVLKDNRDNKDKVKYKEYNKSQTSKDNHSTNLNTNNTNNLQNTNRTNYTNSNQANYASHSNYTMNLGYTNNNMNLGQFSNKHKVKKGSSNSIDMTNMTNMTNINLSNTAHTNQINENYNEDNNEDDNDKLNIYDKDNVTRTNKSSAIKSRRGNSVENNKISNRIHSSNTFNDYNTFNTFNDYDNYNESINNDEDNIRKKNNTITNNIRQNTYSYNVQNTYSLKDSTRFKDINEITLDNNEVSISYTKAYIKFLENLRRRPPYGDDDYHLEIESEDEEVLNTELNNSQEDLLKGNEVEEIEELNFYNNTFENNTNKGKQIYLETDNTKTKVDSNNSSNINSKTNVISNNKCNSNTNNNTNKSYNSNNKISSNNNNNTSNTIINKKSINNNNNINNISNNNINRLDNNKNISNISNNSNNSNNNDNISTDNYLLTNPTPYTNIYKLENTNTNPTPTNQKKKSKEVKPIIQKHITFSGASPLDINTFPSTSTNKSMSGMSAHRRLTILIDHVKKRKENIDNIKLIEGTNEIHIYNSKMNKSLKLKVDLNYNTHGYSCFKDGCRSLLIGNKFYITGGRDSKQEYKITLCYNKDTNTLTKLSNMWVNRTYHSLIYHTESNSIFSIGGENNKSTEVYSIENNTWTQLPNMNYARANAALNIFGGSYIYAMFGLKNEIYKKKYEPTMERLNLNNINNWDKINYKNIAEIDTNKIETNGMLQVTSTRAIMYGGIESRKSTRTSVLFDSEKNEIASITEKVLDEIETQINIDEAILNFTKLQQK